MLLGLEQNEKVDVWALGILLFEMVCGEAPFKGSTKEELHACMKKSMPFSEQFTSAEIDLIKTILRVSAHKRPTVTAILQHRFFDSCELKKSGSSSTVGTQGSDDVLVLPASDRSAGSSRNVSQELEQFQSKAKELSRIRRQFRFKSGELD